MSILGDLILSSRRALRGESQSQHLVADRLGVHQSTISDWENGKRIPSEKRLLDISSVLLIEVSKLKEAWEEDKRVLALSRVSPLPRYLAEHREEKTHLWFIGPLRFLMRAIDAEPQLGTLLSEAIRRGHSLHLPWFLDDNDGDTEMYFALHTLRGLRDAEEGVKGSVHVYGMSFGYHDPLYPTEYHVPPIEIANRIANDKSPSPHWLKLEGFKAMVKTRLSREYFPLLPRLICSDGKMVGRHSLTLLINVGTESLGGRTKVNLIPLFDDSVLISYLSLGFAKDFNEAADLIAT